MAFVIDMNFSTFALSTAIETLYFFAVSALSFSISKISKCHLKKQIKGLNIVFNIGRLLFVLFYAVMMGENL